MRKSNLFTLFILGLMVVLVLTISFFRERQGTQVALSEEEQIEQKQEPDKDKEPEDEKEPENNNEQTKEEQEESDQEETQTIIPASFENTLFIGDSRTVGIMEYAKLEEPDFFCDTGMSVFNIEKARTSVPNVGKVTLEELLSNRQYDKIYIMLGINEIGYNLEKIVSQYQNLLTYISNMQPQAIIFVQANLHVSKSVDDKNSYTNNASLNRLNEELSRFENKKTIYFIDANPLFDDENGNLDSDKTDDGAHLYARLYPEWGEWIREETARVCKEEMP